MPRPAPAIKHTQIAIRVPQPWVKEAKEIAEMLSRTGVERATTTTAFRAAIEKGLMVLRWENELALELRLDEALWDVLGVIGHEPIAKAAIEKALYPKGYNANWPHLGRNLDELVRVGYVKEHAGKYRSTAKGRIMWRTEMLVRAEESDAKGRK